MKNTQTQLKAVEISDLGGRETTSYVAHSEADCKDSTDASVYREVIRSGDVIMMGKIIGRPGPSYDLTDVGCYVDGARGIHAPDRIIIFVNHHGATIKNPSDAYAEDLFDAEDEATNYMNQNYAVEGAFWGRNENGDWGLWSSEEALADQTRTVDGEDAEEWERRADEANTYEENRQ